MKMTFDTPEKFVERVLTEDLTTEQLRRIKILADLRLGKLRGEVKVEVENVPDADRDVSLFYHCLSQLVLKKNGERIPQLGTLRRVNNGLYLKVIECTRYLVEFRKHNAPRLPSSAHATMYSLFLRLAYDYCRSDGIVSTARLCSLADMCGRLIDHAYPGYIEAGLFTVVLTGKIP